MTAERPEPDYQAPEGFEFVAKVNEGWRLVTGKGCRRTGAERRACGRPAVAEMDRGYRFSGHRPGQQNWWAYCADHLYGNWIEDGQVMHWILRKTDGEDA